MSLTIAIKAYLQGQGVLFPESIDAYIKPDAPVRLISAIVDQLDLTQVLSSYSGGGCSCYSPRMLLKALFYDEPCWQTQSQVRERLSFSGARLSSPALYRLSIAWAMPQVESKPLHRSQSHLTGIQEKSKGVAYF